MTKPTERQQKIFEAMRNGAKLVLLHGLNPSVFLSPSIKGVKVLANDPWNMERKGLIKVSRQEWNSTEYKVKEELK